MSSGLSVKVQVKRKFWFIVLQKLVLFLGSNGLLSLERALAIVNSALPLGAFKYRVNNSRWLKLRIEEKLVIEE